MSKAPPRVVLDTNIVLSALLFGGGPAGRVRMGWQARRFVPLASASTAQELVRVLAHPNFRLSARDQEELLADWLPWVEVVLMPDRLFATPRCRDPHDLPFLHLTIVARAHSLVSGDADLLALAETRALCTVMGVAEFCERFLCE
jgi:putative PIN family toxin of toxin-antitoxin system